MGEYNLIEKEVAYMRVSVLPKTSRGKKSVGLFVIFGILGIVANRLSAYLGNQIEYPTPLNRPFLGTVIYLAFCIAIGAGYYGIKAVTKDKERSVLVFLVIGFGAYILLGILVLVIANLLHN
ncbi:MAG: hypothetical protein PHS94_01320 [Erysipelotrichaceae bacterium]|nr:hypothetical protein [Erysipelotrichaceae bacterium]